MKKRFLLVRFLPTAGILGERGEERRKFVAGVRECEMLPHLPRIPLEVTLKKFQLDTRHELATNVQLDRGARPGLDTFTLPVSVHCVHTREARRASLSTWGPWALKGKGRTGRWSPLEYSAKISGPKRHGVYAREKFPRVRESGRFSIHPPRSDRFPITFGRRVLPGGLFCCRFRPTGFAYGYGFVYTVRGVMDREKRRSESSERAFSRVIHFVEHLPLCGRRDTDLLPALQSNPYVTHAVSSVYYAVEI